MALVLCDMLPLGSDALWNLPFRPVNLYLAISGEIFDEGFYLVKIQWLKFVKVDSANQQRYRIG